MIHPSAVVRGLVVGAFGTMGVLHFVPSTARTMGAMVPPPLRGRPFRARTLVRLTGVCELAGAVGLLVPSTRPLAGRCLLAFLVAVFPANAYAARHPDRFGSAAIPFWPRLAGQVGIGAAVAVAAAPLRLQRGGG